MDEKKGYIESSLEHMIKVWTALDYDNIEIVKALSENNVNLVQISNDIDDAMNDLIENH